MKTFSDFENALGYVFKDKSVLLNALTHTSYANERFRTDKHLKSNERIEFVGDAVLGLIAANYIYNSFPQMPEGKMSKLRASVVCEATLAKLAVGLGIDVFLRLGVGEDQTGGRQKASLLADAFESVLGAVFVDGGFHAAESVLLPMLIPEINARVTGSDLSDFKSSLQELLSKRHLSATYKIIAAEGPDHEKVFTACVTTEDGLSACGKGRSKKEAEQRAAETILKQLGSV